MVRTRSGNVSTTPKNTIKTIVEEPSNVVYIGHLPHGFYEDQMKNYFSQFGRVSKIRLSRNKKTGKSKHYAFLEFASSEVAQVAATSMDGYMLLGQKLITRVVPKSEIHPDLFKGANRVFTKIPWHKIEEQRHNKVRSPEEEAKRASRQLRREKKRQRETAQAGIDYVYEEEEEEEVQPDSIIKSAPKETKQKPGKGIAKTRKTKPPSTRKA